MERQISLTHPSGTIDKRTPSELPAQKAVRRHVPCLDQRKVLVYSRDACGGGGGGSAKSGPYPVHLQSACVKVVWIGYELYAGGPPRSVVAQHAPDLAWTHRA